jgi:primary-amine oxidase
MAITVTHPLDPLTADELAAAVAILRESPDVGEVRFVDVALEEPSKAALAAWRDGGERPPRVARASLLDPVAGRALEARIDVDAGGLAGLRVVPDVQPAIHPEEFVAGAEAVRRDPAYQAALARRGLAPDEVHIEPWSCGDLEPDDRRVARAISWRRDGGPNPYAHPIGGLVAVVDLNRMEVVRVDDHGIVPIPAESGDYRAPEGGFREQAPIRITQPEGVTFSLDGNEVTWQRWRFRLGYTAREALVLHDVAYRDGDEWRPVCHRASIAELVIPYGDPAPTTHYKNAFDVGEYGMGAMANALELGCDCLGEIRYRDADLVSWHGEPTRLANAICLHEEDAGILWKHVDDDGGVEVRRARRFVASCICTVGNYEYGYYWYLGQDGSLAFEVRLTGVLHTTAVEPGTVGPHSTEVAPGLAAPYHQHFLCARLDMDVDGAANRVVEVEWERDPRGPDNPHGTSFRTRRTVLASESGAVRDVNPLAARRWRVESVERTNRMGHPTAYELVPGDNVAPAPHPDSGFVRRAGFIEHHLWVTPQRDDERYPAGEYPNQHRGGDGLPRWTAKDRALEGEDVVLWYVFGAHHPPRLEDWPVMPVARHGFELRPVGFFDRNPALDVPPPDAHCAHHG